MWAYHFFFVENYLNCLFSQDYFFDIIVIRICVKNTKISCVKFHFIFKSFQQIEFYITWYIVIENLKQRVCQMFIFCKIRQLARHLFMNHLLDITIYKCNVLIYFSHDYHTNSVSHPAVLTYSWYSIN